MVEVLKKQLVPVSRHRWQTTGRCARGKQMVVQDTWIGDHVLVIIMLFSW